MPPDFECVPSTQMTSYPFPSTPIRHPPPPHDMNKTRRIAAPTIHGQTGRRAAALPPVELAAAGCADHDAAPPGIGRRDEVQAAPFQ